MSGTFCSFFDRIRAGLIMRADGFRLPCVVFSSVLAAVIVAGCSPTETGSTGATTGGSKSIPTSRSDSSIVRDELDVPVDPCSLLNEEQISKYGEFIGPKDSFLKGDPVCSWRVPKETASDSDAPLVDLIYLDDLGTGDVVDLGDGLTSGTTEATGRELVKTSGVNPVTGTPDCLVSMRVSDRARLDVMVGFTSDPCELAGKIVEMVDSKLPRS
ncbi:DUF3558 family protein [Saccharomonospora xinjiangensis]|uniref:DUF3558 family protein n=1 Tax=Saccharomonospora xinjiangensis TaxID=75294 RepID=UPI001E5143EA|nr:DUF3558 family protein [Saccharomonospora xinjiangensis]